MWLLKWSNVSNQRDSFKIVFLFSNLSSKNNNKQIRNNKHSEQLQFLAVKLHVNTSIFGCYVFRSIHTYTLEYYWHRITIHINNIPFHSNISMCCIHKCVHIFYSIFFRKSMEWLKIQTHKQIFFYSSVACFLSYTHIVCLCVIDK